VTSAGLTRSNTYAEGFRKALTANLPALEYTTLKLAQPVFIGTGAADHDVAPSSQLALVKDACAAGTVVEAHLYAGLSHSPTVNASLKDSLPFVRKVLAGEPSTPICEPAAEKALAEAGRGRSKIGSRHWLSHADLPRACGGPR
jgi:hypothetical protein